MPQKGRQEWRIFSKRTNNSSYIESKINKMIQSTISADIVSSSSLTVDEKVKISTNIRSFLADLESNSHEQFWGRMVKGDAVEMYCADPCRALRVALQLKSLVKMQQIYPQENVSLDVIRRRSLFQKYGVRIAIGVGNMNVVDKSQDLLDGDAIYFSGRLMEHQGTSQKERAVVKNTLFFKTYDHEMTQRMNVILGFLDVIFKKANARQSEILYLKLAGKTEAEIAGLLHIKQSAVNQHSTALGWNAIEQAVLYYENLKFVNL